MANTPLHIPELVKRNKWTDYRDPIWGDSYTWSWERTPQEVKYLVIHHSVTSPDATPDDIALLHKARGWGGIGYHFVITKDGMVWYVGDVGTARANVLDMNEKVIGICMIGDFTKALPTDEQITSAHYLCEFFFTAGPWVNVKGWDDVVGHKELQSTACPGTSWDKTQGGDMWWRIKTNTVYTPQPTPEPPPTDPTPPPQPDCEKTIAGLRSRITDLTNQLAAATAEVANREEQVSRLKEEVLNKEKLYTTLQKTSQDSIDSLEGTVRVLEGKVEGLAKEKGQLAKDLAVCKTGLPKGFFARLKLLFS